MACSIYGRETVRYTYNYTDTNSTIQSNTLDWSMVDTLLNTDDNTTTLTDVFEDATQDKIYETAGVKSVHCEVDFGDGWGNVFIHETNLTVEAKVYEPPTLDFTWTPEEPTILDEVQFTQAHDDVRDDTVPKQYGYIDRVDIDFYNDGTDEEVDIEKDTSFIKVFSSKEDGIEIKLLATYWDGYELQTTELVKSMDMSNIPPEALYDREDNGQCIPAYVWTAVSTDLDDDDATLTHNWKLHNVDTNELLVEGDETEFSYPFQYEGTYRVTLRSTDTEGDWTEKIDEFPITFSECDSSNSSDGNGHSSGTIVLRPNDVQIIAVPVKGQKIYEYFLQRIEDITGGVASDYIKLVKAYPSSDESVGKYLVFVPGLTNPASSTNFQLYTTDGVHKEINGFVCETKDFSGTVEFTWDSADEVV